MEDMPLNYSIIGHAAFICAILGFGLGVISKNELEKIEKSAIMSLIGIVCSNIMIWLFTIAAVFMILEELNIFKFFA
jgi:hypothetical protein